MRFVKMGVITLAAFSGLIALPATASAQGNSNSTGNKAILDAIQTLQQTVNGLVASSAPGKVLFTPAAVVEGTSISSCIVTNVVNASREVSIALIDASDGGATLSDQTMTILPGHYGIVNSSGTRPYIAFCRISVNDGTKDDVRGVLYNVAAGSGDYRWINPLPAK